MSTFIIPAYSLDLNPLRSEESACSICLHWACNPNSPVYARNGRSRVKVGQCTCDSDNAPYAAADLMDTFTFTPADGCCAAFELDPQVAADQAAMAEHYPYLDNQLTRDAWM